MVLEYIRFSVYFMIYVREREFFIQNSVNFYYFTFIRIFLIH